MSCWLEIPFKRGVSLLIDAADWGHVSQWQWRLLTNGYLGRSVRGELCTHCGRRPSGLVYLHRFLFPDIPSGLWVDHINGIRTDNRRKNLRLVSPGENTHNRASRGAGDFRGVHKVGSKWRAHISFKGRFMSLGHFATPEEAAQAYDRAAKNLYGEHARTNF